MVDDPRRAQLHVQVPVFSDERPPLQAKVTIEEGAVVVTIHRRDGVAITDEGAGIRVDAAGDRYVDFNGWTV